MRCYRSKLKLAKKLPAIPFLPIVLKDLLFLKENASWLEPELVNFAKHRCVQQLVKKNRRWTSKQYWFAQDLMFIPFFSIHLKQTGALDSISDWMEDRLNEIQ
ncbi:hypothetical protein BY458DRAFT_563979 [Sporodiniella umbellata]|nr:hypothetical protein BY458DRAFT_563979 [Sporodiniella umbellata]